MRDSVLRDWMTDGRCREKGQKAGSESVMIRREDVCYGRAGLATGRVMGTGLKAGIAKGKGTRNVEEEPAVTESGTRATRVHEVGDQSGREDAPSA